MTGSMYAAVSGLKAHMNALNVIGNNVSNVNTTGYKATRYTFNEALYTSQRSGSNGTAIAGGKNPAQIGFGASIGTIDLDMSTKNYSPTGKALDTMIDGDGFFFVGDKEAGAGATAVELSDPSALAGMKLTRLGNFDIDPNGYLVDGNGSVVWGMLEQEYDLSTEFELGTGQNSQKVKLSDMTEEQVETLRQKGTELHNVKYEEKDVNGVKTKVVSRATFTQSSCITAIRLPMVQKTVTQDANGNDVTAKTVQFPTYTASTPATENPPAPMVPAKMTDYDTPPAGSTIERLQADSVTIDEKSGALRVMTSEGELYTVGYLTVGKVTNPNGVTHVDGRYYQALDGAGTLRVCSIKGAIEGIDSAGETKLITGGLESSGTDLATEITNMITVQRGYQANTRIVTVTDSMLEELINMKR